MHGRAGGGRPFCYLSLPSLSLSPPSLSLSPPGSGPWSRRALSRALCLTPTLSLWLEGGGGS